MEKGGRRKGEGERKVRRKEEEGKKKKEKKILGVRNSPGY